MTATELNTLRQSDPILAEQIAQEAMTLQLSLSTVSSLIGALGYAQTNPETPTVFRESIAGMAMQLNGLWEGAASRAHARLTRPMTDVAAITFDPKQLN